MTVQGSGEMGGSVLTGARRADQPELVRRAEQLCRRSEPHTDTVPCASHLHEAQRQLAMLAD